MTVAGGLIALIVEDDVFQHRTVARMPRSLGAARLAVMLWQKTRKLTTGNRNGQRGGNDE